MLFGISTTCAAPFMRAMSVFDLAHSSSGISFSQSLINKNWLKLEVGYVGVGGHHLRLLVEDLAVGGPMK
jgi:hypothetical protein